MTIIEDAVKRLEAARKTTGEGRPELKPVGRVVEREAESATDAAEAWEAGAGPELVRSVEAVEAPAPAEDRAPEPRPEGAIPEASGGRIVAIDRDALREGGLMPPEDEEGMLIDQFRHIKRPIVAHAFGRRATRIKEGRLVMVGSALSGEGKTFTCINLALSIAREHGVHVVLVDADVAKPHITRMFGLENEPGLLDALEDPEAFERSEIVLGTDVPGLSLVPAGRPRPSATELLSSERMETLLAAYRHDDAERLILFDSPPLLQTPEARVLGGLVGQIALVVKAGKTPQHAVLDAIGMLDPEKAVNLVLNQSRGGGSGGYGYGYGYGYGRRDSEGSGQRSA